MKIAKLFKNGQSQAVRLPKEFRFANDQVYVEKMGNCVVLIPIENRSMLLVECLNEFSSDFMEERNQPSLQHRGDIF